MPRSGCVICVQPDKWLSIPANELPMSISAPNTDATEAQFEAQVRAAILHALPWLPGEGITHQKSFTFRFGHATVTVAAEAKKYARARADVLVLFKGERLALFELKRPGIKLTAEDDEQGLSYARMMHPRPPLVVISNGKDVRILSTHTGSLWEPQSRSEQALAALIAQGTEVAQADLKRAVEILMGSDPDIWVQAVRQATDQLLEELTGDWGDPVSPFVDSFLLPRKVSRGVLQLLQERKRLVTVEGGPLSGKSNALREIAKLTAAHAELALLYLDADVGVDVFERLALILAHALDWPLTSDEARRWLVNLSRGDGPALVLAIDNVGPDRNDLRRDIETLTTNLFGPALRVVLAVDDGIAHQLVTQRDGRGLSALGRRADRLQLGPLDNVEFRAAEQHLAVHRLTFVRGARYSNELRAPWLIRAMASEAATSPEYQNKGLAAAMSPVPGLELIAHARMTFDVSQAPFARFRELAKAALEDGQDGSRPYELVLELLDTFIVRRPTAFRHLASEEIREMLDMGLIRETRSASGENVFVVRLPELMASELSHLLAEELPALARDDPSEAAEWLVGAAGNLPLGDVIAAQALVDAAIRNHGLSLQLITELRKRPPSQSVISPGTRSAAWMPGVGVFSMTHQVGGALVIEHGGKEYPAEPEEGEEGEHFAYTDYQPYLILSHLAGHRFELVGTDGSAGPRLDPDLLVGVGSVPLLLRRPGGDPDVAAIPMHDVEKDLSVVCHKAGLVEPISWSLVHFLGREDEGMRDRFIDFALDAAEPPLLVRLDIALTQTEQSADRSRANWARSVRTHRIKPLLETGLASYLHS